MTRKIVAVAAVAVAALLLSGTLDAADARKGGFRGGFHGGGKVHGLGGGRFHGFRAHKFHGGFNGGFKYGGFHRHKFHGFHRHRFHRHFHVGVPLVYGAYYGSSCYWLRRKALHTGSGYWWNRYYDCLNGYY
jgi:hypothetical protein